MKLKLKALILAVAMCAAALTATGCGRLEEIDPFDEQYISYQFSGVSGYTGEFMLDPRSAPLVLTTSYRSDYDKPLSNGDVVKLTVTPPEEELKEAGYKLSRLETEVVVEGLEEIPNELPEDAANTIMDALKEATFSKNEEFLYEVGDTTDGYREGRVKSVGEPQLVRGLYEVVTDKNADSAFQNEEESETDYLFPPTALFTAMWSITYEAEYLEDAIYDTGEVKAGDVFTKTDLYCASISGFTILDGKVHWDESITPFCNYYNDVDGEDYMEYGDFDSLSDKEHLASVEY